MFVKEPQIFSFNMETNLRQSSLSLSDTLSVVHSLLWNVNYEDDSIVPAYVSWRAMHYARLIIEFLRIHITTALEKSDIGERQRL